MFEMLVTSYYFGAVRRGDIRLTLLIARSPVMGSCYSLFLGVCSDS